MGEERVGKGGWRAGTMRASPGWDYKYEEGGVEAFSEEELHAARPRGLRRGGREGKGEGGDDTLLREDLRPLDFDPVALRVPDELHDW